MITVHVTQAHIYAGIAKDCDKCPVALALNEATGHDDWQVNGSAMWRGLDWVHTVRCPLEVIDFISLFDGHEPVGPFSFDLDIEPDNPFEFDLGGEG